jgi:hypothetical protein
VFLCAVVREKEIPLAQDLVSGLSL